MNNIFYPSKNDNKKIYIAVLTKGTDIEAKDVTLEYRRKKEDEFFKYINIDINKSIFMHQIHQVNIVKIDENNINMYGGREKVVENTDALITNLKNVPLVVQTADCAPVIVYCDKTKSIGAIHSSWKGTRDKIVPKTIELMIKEYNADPSKMYVYIAPYIALKNYEVGEEVAVHFNNKTMINDIGIMVTNMNKALDKNNHYYLSSLGDWYYSKYKVNVILSDIELSVENYLKAIEAKKNNYIYYEKLANAYILKNDYNNASKYYKMAIEICDEDTDLIKDAVYLLKNDMNNNGNIVIEYLKRVIEINKNDDEVLEQLAKIYESLGDSYNAQIYYTKLLEVINYNLYIINNEKPNPVLYDKYIKKRNEVTKKLTAFK